MNVLVRVVAKLEVFLAVLFAGLQELLLRLVDERTSNVLANTPNKGLEEVVTLLGKQHRLFNGHSPSLAGLRLPARHLTNTLLASRTVMRRIGRNTAHNVEKVLLDDQLVGPDGRSQPTNPRVVGRDRNRLASTGSNDTHQSTAKGRVVRTRHGDADRGVGLPVGVHAGVVESRVQVLAKVGRDSCGRRVVNTTLVVKLRKIHFSICFSMVFKHNQNGAL